MWFWHISSAAHILCCNAYKCSIALGICFILLNSKLNVIVKKLCSIASYFYMWNAKSILTRLFNFTVLNAGLHIKTEIMKQVCATGSLALDKKTYMSSSNWSNKTCLLDSRQFHQVRSGDVIRSHFIYAMTLWHNRGRGGSTTKGPAPLLPPCDEKPFTNCIST